MAAKRESLRFKYARVMDGLHNKIVDAFVPHRRKTRAVARARKRAVERARRGT